MIGLRHYSSLKTAALILTGMVRLEPQEALALAQKFVDWDEDFEGDAGTIKKKGFEYRALRAPFSVVGTNSR